MTQQLSDEVTEAATRARVAARSLARASTAQKDAALHAAADALLANTDTLLAANARDLDAARAADVSASLLDRLALTSARIDQIAAGLAQVAALPDPIGVVERGSSLPNGLQLRQLRVPLGVVGIVYEARPNVTVDAFGLTLKSGNAVLLRGSSSAAHTNAELVRVLRGALAGTDIDPDAVQLISAESRDTVTALITARGLVDVVIPRGGAGLIAAVVAGATVPTIETGVGNCHIYLDASVPAERAIAITLNSKTRRPSVCNTVETVLVHESRRDDLLPALLEAFAAAGVTVHGDEPGMIPATETDWADEYLSLDVAVKVVPDLDAAVGHIDRYGTGHTEAILTESLGAAREFVARVDAAAVMVNASTGFTDGEQFGFGAEIGISTQKLHARGPMALPELTTTKWEVWGDGQLRTP